MSSLRFFAAKKAEVVYDLFIDSLKKTGLSMETFSNYG